MEQRLDEFWDDMEASQERAKAMKAESARRQRTFFTVTLSLMAAGLGVTAILLVRSRQRNRQAARQFQGFDGRRTAPPQDRGDGFAPPPGR